MHVPAFRERFNAMVERLWAHPEVEVYEAVVRPPASARAIRDAEEAVGSRLPDDVRAFYMAHDGVFLEWGLRGREYEARTPEFAYPDYGQPPGCINLVPVARAMTPGWELDCHVNIVGEEHQKHLFGAPLDPQPPVRSVCVDNFSKYNHGDLVFGPEPVMVVSTDHGADMDSSDFVSFSLYLEITLAIFGANRYSHGLGIGWSRWSKRVTEWTRVLELDALIAELRADEE